VDPVIAEDGRTYERSAIQQWLAAGHRTSPITRAAISSVLIPNRAIRDEVERVSATVAVTAAATATAATATAAPSAATAPVASKSVDSPLSITAAYDPTNRLLHVEFAADRQVSEGTDMILILDTSGSMVNRIASAGKEAQAVTRLDIAKHSARVLGALCSPADRICLLSFNSTATVEMPFTKMDETGKARLDTALSALGAEGATNLWDAIRIAVGEANRVSGRRVAAILLTDGEPTTGTPPRGLLETMRSALVLKEPWTLHALGFSDAVDSTLLSAIAEWGHGSFGFIPSGDMVGTVCINTAAHCLSVAHRGTQFRLPPDRAQPGGAVFDTGPILVQQPRDFVIDCDTAPATIQCDGQTIPVTTRVVRPFLLARHRFLKTLDTVLLQRDAHVMEGLLHEFVRLHADTTDPRTKLLIRDVTSANSQEGQVLLSTKYLGTWGRHYLRCYRSAQHLQHCINFKDVGLQDYGGPLFQRLVTEGDKTFAMMPPMPVSVVSSGSSGYYAAAAAATPPSAANATVPVDYSMFHNSSGGCFSGDCCVRMAREAVMLPIADLRRGDLVWTPDGPATVLFAVELRTKARSQPMVQIGRLSITPWHPIRRNGEWIFPAHVHGYQDRLVNTVYNLVLSRGHIIDVEGVQCVTLAHGFVDPVVKHDFFGTHAVVESMQRQPGFTEGRPVFENLVAIKNEDGVVNRWVDHVIREEM
jgi:Mg-chelatase subunit ChlD